MSRYGIFQRAPHYIVNTEKPYDFSLIGIAVAVFAVLLFSKPFAPTWYDENYSLIMFVDRGVRRILSDYHVPNNHILYSLGQWAWRSVVGEDVFLNRLLPLLLTILAIPGLYLAGTRMHGRLAGLIACLTFSTSHVVGNYSAQLRGYGLTLGLLSLALGCAVAWWRDDYRGWKWPVGYVLASALAVGVIPTNAVFSAALGSWLVIEAWRKRVGVAPVVLAWVLPLSGLLFYAGVWWQFLSIARNGHWYVYGDFVRELTRDLFLYDMPWSLPLIAIGPIWLREAKLRRSFVVMAIVFGATLLVPLLGSVPWPRNYLPLLPVCATLSAVVLAELAQNCGGTNISRGAMLAVALLTIAVVCREATLHLYRDNRVQQANGRPTTLIDQYQFLPSYNKSEIEGLIARAETTSVLVMPSDVYWDMAGALTRKTPAIGSAVLCIAHRDRTECQSKRGSRAAPSRLYVVDWDTTRHEKLVRNLLGILNITGDTHLAVVSDSGQFKMWTGSIGVVAAMDNSDNVQSGTRVP